MGNSDTNAQGILPARTIAAYCEQGLIRLGQPADADQIQPASLDLRLGHWAYRVRASFLPGKRSTVADRVAELALHRMPLTEGAVLETGCVYIVPLLEVAGLAEGRFRRRKPQELHRAARHLHPRHHRPCTGIRQGAGRL